MILRVRKSALDGNSGTGRGAGAEGGDLPPPKVGSAVNESEWMALKEMRKGALALGTLEGEGPQQEGKKMWIKRSGRSRNLRCCRVS
jgi:hypothetical protein